jgi:Uma2 family endonuclease
MTLTPRRVELAFEVPWTHPSWELEDEQTPESAVQDEAAGLMASTWRLWARRKNVAAVVRRNLAVRWDEEHPRIGVDPDVCLLIPPPATREEDLSSLRLWEPGNAPPRVAFEVVSEANPRKDYDHGPRKYAACGVAEVWVFDPMEYGPIDDGGPWLLQVWARGRRGELRRVYAGDGPAKSDALDAWLVITDGGTRLRVSDDEGATSLWPTEAEEAERNRVARDDAEAKLAAAMARVAELEARLAKG